jgi:hypothetical protein
MTCSSSPGVLPSYVLAVLVVVVVPAIWSKKKQQRDSALAGLDRLFGR